MEEKNVLNNETKEYAKKCFKEIIDIGTDFKLNEKTKKKVFDNKHKEKIFEMPNETQSVENIIKEMEENILPYCTNWSSPNFMGFPDAGNSIAGISGAIFSDFLQQNLANASICAPIGTYMEIAVIRWLRDVVGYENNEVEDIWDAGGIITYGGTASNAVAMMLARENHQKDTMVEGVKNPEDFKIVVPKGISHYSIKSSQMWIGCGDNVIEVPTKSYRYDLEELKKTLEENKGKIMAVVAWVGDSRSMTIDNLKEVHDIVKTVDSNIWLHADACHGFSLGFSEKLKEKIKGIELYDSISTDPHKVLMTPYAMSALLVKEPHKFKTITSTSDFLLKEPYAFGQITPFIGSKSWMSLKAWFMFKNLGKKGIGDIIERRCKMAQYLKKLIDESDEFIALNDVEINSVMFMYVKDKNNITMNTEQINEINKKIKNKIDSDGIYFLHQFPINDDNARIGKDATVYPLRYMSGNDNITEKHIKNMLDYVSKIAKELQNI